MKGSARRALALLAARQRHGEEAAAERAWPVAVAPTRATAFDMIGAADALRTLPLSAAIEERLAAYLAAYPGRAGGPYNNLELVEALAVIATAAAGLPAPRYEQALRMVNVTVPRMVTAGGYLSDPRSHPLAGGTCSRRALGTRARRTHRRRRWAGGRPRVPRCGPAAA